MGRQLRGTQKAHGPFDAISAQSSRSQFEYIPNMGTVNYLCFPLSDGNIFDAVEARFLNEWKSIRDSRSQFLRLLSNWSSKNGHGMLRTLSQPHEIAKKQQFRISCQLLCQTFSRLSTSEIKALSRLISHFNILRKAEISTQDKKKRFLSKITPLLFLFPTPTYEYISYIGSSFTTILSFSFSLESAQTSIWTRFPCTCCTV